MTRRPPFARRVFPLIATLLSVGWSGCRPAAPPRETAVPASPPAEGGKIAFRDRAREAGLAYRWTLPGKTPRSLLQTIGNGCAFLDYDGDGNLDILLVGPQVALYKGDGRGNFKDVSAETGIAALKGDFSGCAVGDYDNDGLDDIYLTAYRGGALLHNEAADLKSKHPQAGARNPKFRDVTAGAGIPTQPWGTSAAFLDADGDGKLDLIICNYLKYSPDRPPQLCKNNGVMSACGPRFYDPEFARLYRNEGQNRFRDITAEKIGAIAGKGLGVACADFDNAGRIGIALANDEMPGDLLRNGDGKFRNIGPESGSAYDPNGNPHGGMGIDWGDYDNDGKLDLAVATFQREVKSVFRNEGGAVFRDASRQMSLDSAFLSVTFGLKWVDFDNDGYLDLILANGHVWDNADAVEKGTSFRQQMLLYHNEKGRAFTDASNRLDSAAARPILGRGLALGDYDNDGKADILIVDSDGAPLLLHNETADAGHFLGIKLSQPMDGNRDAYGAMITVEAGGKKIMRHCHADGSYMSSSDPRVLIGLGDAATVDKVTIRWPDGKTDTFARVPADRYVRLERGGALK